MSVAMFGRDQPVIVSRPQVLRHMTESLLQQQGQPIPSLQSASTALHSTPPLTLASTPEPATPISASASASMISSSAGSSPALSITPVARTTLPGFTLNLNNVCRSPVDAARPEAVPHTPKERVVAGLLAASGAPLTTPNGMPPIQIEPSRASAEAAAEFLALIGAGVGQVLASSDEEVFHEAGIWIPSLGEWLITSGRLKGLDGPYVQLSALSESGSLRDITPHLDADFIMANGGTPDGFGTGAIVCSQGLGALGGSLWHVDVTLTKSTLLLSEPIAGVPFNSPNDIVRHPATGCLILSDPSYGYEQGFRERPHPEAPNCLWCAQPIASTESLSAQGYRCYVLDSDFVKPNGVLLSPDGNTLYATDTGYYNGYGEADASRPRCTYAFDVLVSEDASNVSRLSLRNRRLFATCADGEGVPDGMKCDETGNVYLGCGDGVHVHSPDGTRLGKLLVKGGAANLCFGGALGRTLMILNETRALSIELTTGCALDLDL